MVVSVPSLLAGLQYSLPFRIHLLLLVCFKSFHVCPSIHFTVHFVDEPKWAVGSTNQSASTGSGSMWQLTNGWAFGVWRCLMKMIVQGYCSLPLPTVFLSGLRFGSPIDSAVEELVSSKLPSAKIVPSNKNLASPISGSSSLWRWHRSPFLLQPISKKINLPMLSHHLKVLSVRCREDCPAASNFLYYRFF